MEFLSSYLLSVVGVVLLTVLIDLILPDGKINKYVKSVVAIVVVAVIISPVAKLVKSDFDFSNLFTNSSYQVDEVILNELTNQNLQNYQSEWESNLEKLGYSGVHISIACAEKNGNQIIKYIYVDLCDLVINKNESHIDYYTKIKESVAKLVSNIKEEQIVVYG